MLWAYENAHAGTKMETWLKKLDDGLFKSTECARKEAEGLYKDLCPEYQAGKATSLKKKKGIRKMEELL